MLGSLLVLFSGILLAVLWLFDPSHLRQDASYGDYSDLALGRDGATLLSTGGAGLQRWSVTTTDLVPQWHTSVAKSAALALSPDGTVVATIGATDDTTIDLWQVSDGTPIRTLTGSHKFLDALAFSPDGQLLAATGNEGIIWIWRIANGQVEKTLHQGGWLRSLAFRPDGQMLATGDSDGAIQIWRVSDGQQIRMWHGHRDVVSGLIWRQNGQTLLSCSWDGTIALWQAADGMNVRTFNGHMRGVLSMALSPDEQILASGSGEQGNYEENPQGDLTIRLWQMNDGQQIGVREGHTNWINALVFSPDGHTLFSTGWASPIRRWSVP